MNAPLGHHMVSNKVVLTDADNTLWDTDAVFANAQLGILRAIEDELGVPCRAQDRLAFVRMYDQALAAKHHLHFRYPPLLLSFAIAIGLGGTRADEAAGLAIGGSERARILSIPAAERIVADYRLTLNEAPSLLPGVRDGLARAAAAGLDVYVLTEGRIEKQRETIAHHGLTGSFTGVFEVTKNTQQFERMNRRFAPARIVMVGDQPDRDITPAVQAGCLAVLIPSKFRPGWYESQNRVAASFVATDFAEAISWAAGVDAG